MPEIPGRELQRLGQTITQGGAQLISSLARYRGMLANNEYENAYLQWTRGRRAFLENLDDDFGTYDERWQQTSEELFETISGNIKSQGAKNKFELTYYDETDKMRQNLAGITEARSTAKVMKDNYIRGVEYAEAGDLVKVDDTIQIFRDAGMQEVDGQDINKLQHEWRQEAYKSLARGKFEDLWADPKIGGDAALSWLADPEVRDSFEPLKKLEEERYQNLLREATQRVSVVQDRAEKVSKEEGEKRWDEYLEKSLNDEFETIEERMPYLGLVDDAHQDDVQGDIEALRKAHGISPEEKIANRQDAFANKIISDYWGWAARKKEGESAPVEPEKLSDYVVSQEGMPPKLRGELLSSIRTVMKTAQESHDKGVSEDNLSPILSRLHTAYQENRNPGLDVFISEIDEKITDKEDHTLALNERLKLIGMYEKGLTATKLDTLIEAYQVVYHPNMLKKQKTDWIDARVIAGGGLSPEDGKMLRGWVDSYNDNPDRERAVNAIMDAYKYSMAKEKANEARTQELALERYYALQALETLFVKPETTKADIDKMVDQFLSNRNEVDLLDIIKEEFKEPPGFGGIILGKRRRATMAEYLREQGELTGKQLAEFPGGLRKTAEDLERKALNKAKISAGHSARTSTGDLIWSAEPIKKKANGKFEMSGEGGQGVLYQVRYQIIDNEYVLTIYTQNPNTGDFDVPVQVVK